MILALTALAVAFGAGFGLGRVKNAAKLAAAKAAIAKAEGTITGEAAKLILEIKAKL